MFLVVDGGTGARYIGTHDDIVSYDCECRETFARMFGSFLQCALCVCVWMHAEGESHAIMVDATADHGAAHASLWC